MITSIRVPRKEDVEYIAALQEKRQKEARKADPKAYDAYVKAQYERLFPAK